VPGRWNVYRNGQYIEHRIKPIDRQISKLRRIEPERAIKVGSAPGILGLLLKPLSVIAGPGTAYQT
jgi:hypothetical protein